MWKYLNWEKLYFEKYYYSYENVGGLKIATISDVDTLQLAISTYYWFLNGTLIFDTGFE